MIKITGFKEVDAVLRNLPLAMNDKVLTAAHTRALVPLVNREHLLAPVGKTGNLADSIGVVKASTRGSLNTGLGAVSAGPRRNRPYKGFAGHLVEYGTKQRSTRKGANRGQMPTKPFAHPAWDATRAEVEANVNREIGNEVIRVMRRTLRG